MLKSVARYFDLSRFVACFVTSKKQLDKFSMA